VTYFVIFLALCFVLGGLAVVSNLSLYYGVVGLVLVSVMGCGWWLSLGISFLSLVLFMVYLGGMLVVFVYSVSLAAEPF
ncbi:NU6M oxidoreductase, partial [Hydrobates tethys]|nr:NU6M oxidoreductase [Oceanodroma tethys]